MITAVSSVNFTKQNHNKFDAKSMQSDQISFRANLGKMGKDIFTTDVAQPSSKIRRFTQEARDVIGGAFKKHSGELPISDQPKISPMTYTERIIDRAIRWNSAHPNNTVTVPSKGCTVSAAEAVERAIARKDPTFKGGINLDALMEKKHLHPITEKVDGSDNGILADITEKVGNVLADVAEKAGDVLENVAEKADNVLENVGEFLDDILDLF